MNELFGRMMAKATALTRNGQLGEATLAIQRALRGVQPGASTFTPATPATTAAPSLAPEHAGGHAKDAMVLDGYARVIDITDVTPAVDTESPPEVDVPQEERWIDGSFGHQGRKLAYKLFLPPCAAGVAADPRPMVVMLHGCTQDAADFAAGTRMHALARDLGVVVLYPEQGRHANPQRCWNWFKPQHQQRGRGEPAILAALVHAIAAEHQVDPDRVFIAGLSAGGAMAEIVGRCYPDVFAAVGVHSGLPAGSAKDVATALAVMRSGNAGASAAAVTGAVPPTIVFHGDADAIVHANNGAAIIDAARRANGLDASGVPPAREAEGRTPTGQSYTRTVYSDADGRAAAEYWQLHGAGHAWSGGDARGSYTDPSGVDASAEMLRFFLAHPRRRR
ncbi:esterase [Bordetella sp. H567]|uniref:extracellular catalytic domain type 1 short-chain-length polyhydroxyalkanoate depolymerase n=1 Tax=Bordetella sp. H567 TaxID=1697043 RepID=UPI00081C5380|nr:PHB depolymerase family esterase [Bordetella sp. H567]AOB31438.1 esterase [Bordetella sp. H567]